MESQEMALDENHNNDQSDPWRQHVSEQQAEEEERAHYHVILDAFAYYREYSLRQVYRAQLNYDRLQQGQKKLLPDFAAKIKRWKLCVEANDVFIRQMLLNDPLFINEYGHRTEIDRPRNRVGNHQMSKVESTIRQLNREWAVDSAKERQSCYGLILNALDSYLPVGEAYSQRVLCPGSGLGRLPWEICRRGYACQGNEWSYFMLIAGNTLLNQTQGVNQHTIYPYIHQTSNNVRTNDQFRAVRLPDVNPANLPVGADFSYTAGGFLEVYGAQRGEWDCVVTCFFLDTANNLIDYIECIQNILAPQAFWINFGPLLYHYQDLPHEQSVELSYEELRHVILSYNFSLLEESTHETTYTANPESLMNTLYRGQFFVAQKLT